MRVRPASFWLLCLAALKCTPGPPEKPVVKRVGPALVVTADAPTQAPALATSVPEHANAASFDSSGLDLIVEAGLGREYPGAVVLVITDGKVALKKAYGWRALRPKNIAMTTGATFDLASLTKPIVTATAIMLLGERAQLRNCPKLTQFLVLAESHTLV